jgi:hypothetical protein
MEGAVEEAEGKSESWQWASRSSVPVHGSLEGIALSMPGHGTPIQSVTTSTAQSHLETASCEVVQRALLALDSDAHIPIAHYNVFDGEAAYPKNPVPK